MMSNSTIKTHAYTRKQILNSVSLNNFTYISHVLSSSVHNQVGIPQRGQRVPKGRADLDLKPPQQFIQINVLRQITPFRLPWETAL